MDTQENSNGTGLLTPNYQGAITAATTHYSLLTAFVKRRMLQGIDYGGTDRGWGFGILHPRFRVRPTKRD
jgi:hypothetical protein